MSLVCRWFDVGRCGCGSATTGKFRDLAQSRRLHRPTSTHLHIRQGRQFVFPSAHFQCTPCRPFSLRKRSVWTFFQRHYLTGHPPTALLFRYPRVLLSTPSGTKPTISKIRFSSGVPVAKARSKKYSEAE